jgi:hypothetical protein
MNNTVEHQNLVHEIMLKLGALPYVRIWKQVNGLAVPWGQSNTVNARPIHFGGPNGCADLSGIVNYAQAPGRRLEIEVKTGTARQSMEQKDFQAMIQKFGGIYFIAKSIDEACTKLESAIRF